MVALLDHWSSFWEFHLFFLAKDVHFANPACREKSKIFQYEIIGTRLLAIKLPTFVEIQGYVSRIVQWFSVGLKNYSSSVKAHISTKFSKRTQA